MSQPTLVDSCILIEVPANVPQWAQWSLDQLDRLGRQAALVINPLILAEISPRFERANDLEAALSGLPLVHQDLPSTPRFWQGRLSRFTVSPWAVKLHRYPISILVRMPWWPVCNC